MRVQELRRAIQADPDASRTGIFTTCVLALSTTRIQPALALYFTGHRHAGENLGRVLDHRSKDLPIPMQMSDAHTKLMKLDEKAGGSRKFARYLPFWA